MLLLFVIIGIIILILKIYDVNRRHIEPKWTERDFHRACDQSEPNWTKLNRTANVFGLSKSRLYVNVRLSIRLSESRYVTLVGLSYVKMA